MVGLVLEGGGVKGAYQIGAYYALKKCHIKFDAIVGNSIGAFNAAMLVAKKEKQLLKFWKKADMGRILGLSDEYIKTMNSDSSNLKKALVESQEIINVMKNKGLDINNLKKELSTLVKEEEIRNSKIEYGLDTVRVKDLKPLYLFKDDIPKGQMLDYIISSCYLPVFKMEKMTDGNFYLDGGFYDVSPSNMLVKKGYDTIYIISLKGIGIMHKKDTGAKLITVKPSKNLGKTLNVNKKEINYNIKLGFYDTIKKLKNLDGDKYIFKVKSAKYYERLIRKIDKKELYFIQTLLFTTNTKKLVIKALEYYLKNEKKEYTKIYNPTHLILKVKKSKKDETIYRFIKKLKLF